MLRSAIASLAMGLCLAWLTRASAEPTNPRTVKRAPQPTAARSAPSSAEPDSSASPTPRPTTSLPSSVRTLTQTTAQWRALFAELDSLKPYAADFVPFTTKDADAALERGKRSRGSITAWRFVDAPFTWQAGEQTFWIVSGTSGARSLLVVLSPTGASARHSASLVIAEADAAIAIAESVDHGSELLFTTCYGCPGQSGSIQLGADGQPRFVYR